MSTIQTPRELKLSPTERRTLQQFCKGDQVLTSDFLEALDTGGVTCSLDYGQVRVEITPHRTHQRHVGERVKGSDNPVLAEVAAQVLEARP